MLVVIGAVVGAATTAIAYFVPWLPEQASEQRDGIDFIFWLTTGICISIFALVAAVSIYAAYKFRVRPDDDTDGPPIHGHTGLEIAWTAIPAVLVIVIGVASGIVLARNDRVAADSLRIKVTAQQFAWNFEYPNGVTSGTLRLPVDRDVVLELHARDVIHSFWVPQFGQKQDAVPGIVTQLAITPTKVGSYPLMCTELCGLGHAVMRTQALVLEQGEYDAWARRQGAELAGPPGQAGAAVFENQGCGSCHTFEPARSNAEVGPSLDELASSAEEAGKPLQQYVRESIVEPDAYIHPGFPRNVMPKTYAELPDEQLDGLVQYLVEGNR
jgi:cytochrome c oxidase subunit II